MIMHIRKFRAEKLKSRHGAAMLIALLVFMIAALSGTIALTMAASNAGRYTHEKQDQQAYLSVISAGNLILDRLKDLSIEYKGTHMGLTPINEDEVVVTLDMGSRQPDLFLKDDGFVKNLKQFSLSGAKWDPMEFTLKASEASGMGEVCVNVDAVGNSFSFRLYHVSGSARNYQMTLEVETKFDEGNTYVLDPKDGYVKRHQSFNTDSAKYVVETNASSGGTEK